MSVADVLQNFRINFKQKSTEFAFHYYDRVEIQLPYLAEREKEVACLSFFVVFDAMARHLFEILAPFLVQIFFSPFLLADTLVTIR
jgi:hypothetical protein